VGARGEPSETRVVEQKKLTTGKAALLLILSALGAIVSARELSGWHVYLGFAIIAVVLLVVFLIWNQKS
jgi:hypothetical protein